MNHPLLGRTGLSLAAGLLAILMLLSAFGCASGTPGSTATTESTSVEESETEAPRRESDLEAMDYGGYGFVFADDEVDDKSHEYPEVFAEDASASDPVEAAVYQRNHIIMEKYNVSLISNFEINIYNSLKANEEITDAIMHGPYQLKSTMQEGMLYDLKQLGHIFRFDESWWMGSISDGIAVNNRLYIMSGDLNIRSLASLNVMFFNKDVLETYNKGTDLYQMVEDKTWTFENMNALAKRVSDGGINGVFDENGRYGHAHNSVAVIGFFYGADCRFLTKNEEGELESEFGSERQIAVLTDIVEMLNDPTLTLYGEKYKNLYDNARVWVPQNAFAENRALFQTGLMGHGLVMRKIEPGYGILPMPLYDEAQEHYNTCLHGNSSFIAIPYNVSDPERSARILEDMAFYATDTIRTAYIDVLVKEKISQDDSSKRMVDILYENVTFDLGYFGIGTMDGDLRGMADRNDTNFTSFFDEKAGMWNRLLQAYLRPFQSEQ
ncbi:MAG: hypothetical protein E7618_06720 [Ruminococcaceae bacterium]|nr:hypothetical protein [Oscillospiraceae bacterium]